jgi:hypothetical protein
MLPVSLAPSTVPWRRKKYFLPQTISAAMMCVSRQSISILFVERVNGPERSCGPTLSCDR